MARVKQLISVGIILVFLAWLGYYGYAHRSDFAELTLVSPWLIIVLVLGTLVSYLAISYLNNVLMQSFGVYMKMGESFMLSVVTGFYNLITPFRGGMAVRAVYLKKRYSFAYVNFLASLSAVYVLTFLVASLLGIVSTVWIYYQTGMFSWILFVIFDVVFIGMVGIIFVSPKFKEYDINPPSSRSRSQVVDKIHSRDTLAHPDGKNSTNNYNARNYNANLKSRGRRDNGNGDDNGNSNWKTGLRKWLNRFIKVINGWHLIKKNGRVILVTSFVTLVQILLGSLMLWFQFKVFGVDISFMAAIFLSAIGSLSILIGLTPGNLGVQEAITVFSAATIGISTTESLSAVLLGRAVGLVVLFVLGPIFSYVLMRSKKKGDVKNVRRKK